MSTKHKLRATIPCGDPDLGAEVEVEIAFTYHQGRMAHHTAQWKGGYPHPDEADEIEFLDAARLCNGKPAPFYGAFADMEKASLNDLAEAWLESDEGQREAFEAVADDDERAREYAAEMRADR